MGTAPVLLFLVTALFLLIAVPVPGESKVYYACGAVLDSTESGLILSPGFPNNYLSGFHCVWQFFIPAGSHLQIETLDFDVFESPSDSSTSSDITSVTAYKKVDTNSVRTGSSLLVSPDSVTILTTTEPFGYLSEVNRKGIVSRKSRDRSYKGEDPLLLQGFAAKNNILNHGASTSQKGAIPIASKSDDNLRKDSNKSVYTFTGQSMENNEGITSSSVIMDISTVPYTPQSQLVDVCPDDVLYISDLTRFSMRFCGSNSPLNKMLVFGSPVEMTEVIMELITTTNRGRGFAMLFSYQNQTAVTAMGIQESHSKEDIMLLAVISATISFALVLLLVLCLSYRQKMCPKRDHTTDQVTPQLSGAQNAALDVSELHHVALGEDLGRELDLASQEEKGAELCEQSLQEDPSSSIATVTSDEVFIISDRSNQENFSFTSYPKGHILKRSVTSPASVSDWLNADYTSVDLSMDDKEAESLEVDPARQRTWSIRTFNSFLPPIPQLQVKWSSRISAGSFTKLVASGCNVPPTMPSPPFPRRAGSAIQIEGSTSRLYSESSDSNASYPLTNSAQLNRKLPSCNLKRTRPYFGFLNGTSDALRSSNMKTTCSNEKHLCQNSGTEFTSCFKSPMTNGVHTKELSTDVEKPKTVFVICEEDDQQPLVFDDHLSPSEEMLSASYEGNSGRYEEDAARDGCDISTCVTVPEDYRYPCTRITSSFNSFVTNGSTTVNSRHESAQDAHSQFNQMGLAKD